MTNEEKAKEIAVNHEMTYLELENDGGVYDVNSYDECFASAMEMAAYKDKQFNETLKQANESVTKAHEEGAKIERERIIEKACEWLISNANDYIINDKQDGGRDWLKIKSEMFDDFKKAMEE